ncbi:hypothetical protein [Vibrio sonorensis]|uniref:hypothetical protein n=1 Tax=Vibrio sonorensis TaxID=1004316 RepID=UPI0008DA382D|nr:hypothetical protein [Vibrio sonorensis]
MRESTPRSHRKPLRHDFDERSRDEGEMFARADSIEDQRHKPHRRHASPRQVKLQTRRNRYARKKSQSRLEEQRMRLTREGAAKRRGTEPRSGRSTQRADYRGDESNASIDGGRSTHSYAYRQRTVRRNSNPRHSHYE